MDERTPSVAATAGPIVDSDQPWPGLDAFAESQSAFFFGRTNELEELYQCVRRAVATLLFGQSGLGKTSLVQAGLFPRLRDNGFLPVPVRLGFAPEAPALIAQIKQALNRAIDGAIDGGHLKETARIGDEETLWEFLHRRDVMLVDASDGPVAPVLCIDQFEQLFTLGMLGRRAECIAFLAELADLIENRPPAAVKTRLQRTPALVSRFAFRREDFRIVLVLREDFLPSLEDLREMAPSLGRNRLRLTQLKGAAALDAVMGPGHERAIIGADVAERIVRRVGKADAAQSVDEIEVDSSLLSLFCSELNKRRIANGLPQITDELVEQSSGDILNSFYEDALRGEPPAVRELVEDQLVTRSGARDSVSHERADQFLTEKGVAPAAIDRLVARRLLRIHDRPEGPRIELIHDVLLPIASKASAERHAAAAQKSAEREAAVARRELVATRRRAMAAVVLVLVGATYVLWSYLRLRDTNDQLNQINQRLQQTNQQLQERNDDLHRMNDQMDNYKKSATEYANDLPNAILFLNNRVSDTVTTLTQSPAGNDGYNNGRGKALSSISEADIVKAQDADMKSRYIKLLERDSDLVERLRGLSPDDLNLMKASADIQNKMIAVESNDREASKRYGRAAIKLAVALMHKAQESQIQGCDLLIKGAEALAIDNEGRADAIDLVHGATVAIGGNESELAGFSPDNRMVRISCAALSMLEEAAILSRQATVELADGLQTNSPATLKNARSDFEKAVSRAKDAEDYLQKAAKDGPQPLVALRVGAKTHAQRASLLLTQSRALAAEDANRKQGLVTTALNECETAFGLREAALGGNDTREERGNLAAQASQCGGMFEQQKNVAKARQYYERQLDLRRGLLAGNSDDGVDADQARRSFEDALVAAGTLERTQGDRQKALAELDECIRDAEALVRDGPRPINYHSLYACYAQRGYLAKDLNQYSDTRAYFRYAVSSLLEAQRDPALERVLHELVVSWRRIAVADEKLGDFDDEIESDNRAVDLARDSYGQRQDDETRTDLIDALGGQSFALVLNRQFAKAVEAADAALALIPATKLETMAANASYVDWIKLNRAHGLWLQGQKAEAERIYTELKSSRRSDISDDFGVFLKRKLVTADDVKHIRELVGASVGSPFGTPVRVPGKKN